MSIRAIEADYPGPACRCPICLTGYPYNNAYRPHTLGPDCWCTRAPDETRIKGECWMAKFAGIPQGGG